MNVPTDEQMLDLIAQETLIDRSKLRPEDSFASLGIDSVDAVSVLFALEENYGIRLEAEELTPGQTLQQLMDRVRSRAMAAA